MTLGEGALPALRAAAALCYVDNLDEPALGPDDAHHLASVRRLRSGELVVCSNGRGGWRNCRVVRSGREISLETDGEIGRELAPVPALTVAFSLAKGERTNWAVAKLGELGTDVIVPLICERTVVRPEDGGGRRRRRLQRIADESAMLGRRLFRPQVTEPLRPDEAIELIGASSCALAELGGAPPSLATPALLVGPEGGFAPSERELASSLGIASVGLGPSVLRVETAAVAAGTLLSALRSGLVQPAG